jgi:outer membrane lipopolysaccharide assembly protein LptE/RlpB
MKNITLSVLLIVIVSLLLQSCSGNRFHLRKNTTLSGVYEKIAVQGLSAESALYRTIAQAIVSAGGKVTSLDDATATITLTQIKEDKKIVAYAAKRVAREYMIYLYFDYQIKIATNLLKKRAIRLDKTLIYDANFVLGKAEEKLRIQQSLREEAARLLLLRLRYSKK